MSTIQTLGTAVPASSTTSTTATSPATEATSSQETLSTPSGFGTTSTFGTTTLSPTAQTMVNSTIATLNRPIINLPASVVQPLRDAAIARVNEALGQGLSTTELQAALTTIARDFNAALSAALTQQNLQAQRTSYVTRIYTTVNAPITKLPADVAGPLRDAALAKLDELNSRNPPLSNTALQTEMDKVLRDYNTSVNNAIYRKGLVDNATRQINAPQPQLDQVTLAKWQQETLQKLDALLAQEPPLANSALAVEINKLVGQLRATEVLGIQEKIAVDRAIAQINRDNPLLKLPEGSEANVQRARDAAIKILQVALTASPPPPLAEVNALITKTLADFKANMDRICRGEPPIIQAPADPNAPQDDADMAARRDLANAAIAQLKSLNEVTTADGRKFQIRMVLSAATVERIQGRHVDKINEMLNLDPKPALDELQKMMGEELQKYMFDVMIEKGFSDNFLNGLMGQLRKNQDRLINIMKGIG